MATGRRWLQYSLRSFLVVVTALAVWLGVVFNRAREQREAVKAIEALGGNVIYDWQQIPDQQNPAGPAWLRRIVGDDFFQEVHAVNFFSRLGGWYQPNPIGEPSESDIRRAIPYLQRLKTLKDVVISKHQHKQAAIQFKAALPDCEIISFAIDR